MARRTSPGDMICNRHSAEARQPRGPNVEPASGLAANPVAGGPAWRGSFFIVTQRKRPAKLARGEPRAFRRGSTN
jgi:hypothetical protein